MFRARRSRTEDDNLPQRQRQSSKRSISSLLKTVGVVSSQEERYPGVSMAGPIPSRVGELDSINQCTSSVSLPNLPESSGEDHWKSKSPPVPYRDSPRPIRRSHTSLKSIPLPSQHSRPLSTYSNGVIETSVLTLAPDTPVTDLFDDCTLPAEVYYREVEEVEAVEIAKTRSSLSEPHNSEDEEPLSISTDTLSGMHALGLPPLPVSRSAVLRRTSGGTRINVSPKHLRPPSLVSLPLPSSLSGSSSGAGPRRSFDLNCTTNSSYRNSCPDFESIQHPSVSNVMKTCQSSANLPDAIAHCESSSAVVARRFNLRSGAEQREAQRQSGAASSLVPSHGNETNNDRTPPRVKEALRDRQPSFVPAPRPRPMSIPVTTSALPACSDSPSLAQAHQGDSNTLVSPSPSPPPIRPTPGSIWHALYSKRSKIFGLGRQQNPKGTSVARARPRFGHSPAGIFLFGKNQMEGGVDAVEPKLDEKHLVSLFWHADEQLLRNVHRLREVHPYAHLATRLHRRTDVVHKSQKILLDALHLIAEQVHHDLVRAGDEGLFASRSHRKTLPLDDQRELELGYSENILFAAQALSSGFRIRGLDTNSPTLTQPAQHLIAALEAVRWVLRRRAVIDPYPPYETEEIIAVLRDFDAAWCIFEKLICNEYFSIMYMGRTGQNDVDMFAILMSETLVKAVQRGHLHANQISELDPLIFLALPRLTVVAGLLHFPNLVDLIHPETCIRWFRHKCSRLRELQWELEGLEDCEVLDLEKLLTDGNDDLISSSAQSADQKSTMKTPSPRVQRLFTDVCAIADDLQSGAKAREFVQVLNKVLVMHKNDESAEPQKDVDAATGATIQQVPTGGGPKRKWWQPSRRCAGSGGGTSSRQVQDQTSVTGSS